MKRSSTGSRSRQARSRAAVFDALPDGLLVLDDEGRVVDLNARATELLGRARRACRGKPATALLPGWVAAGGGDAPPRTVRVGPDQRPVVIEQRLLAALRRGRLLVLRDVGPATPQDVPVPTTPRDVKGTETAKPRRGEHGRKRPNLLAQILSVSDFLRLHPDRSEALQEIVNAARVALGFDIVVLNLLDSRTGIYDLHAFAGLAPEGQEVLAKAVYTRETIAPLLREEFRQGRCYFIPAGAIDWEHDFAGPTYNPLAADPTWSKLSSSDAWDPQDALMVPIEARTGEIVGLLWVDAPVDGRRPDAETLRALEIFANQAAVAIENAQLFAEVQHLTIVDELTQLYNRRGLFQLGSHELERTRRFGRPLAALFLDIDHFRTFNNRYSHAVGDEVLRAVAGRCRADLRSIDLVGRYGGEEFVALLLETPLEEAVGVAERLRAGIAGMRVPTPRGALGVTVSVGVAPLADDMPDLAALVDRTNQAEHLAKEAGRNRVVALP